LLLLLLLLLPPPPPPPPPPPLLLPLPPPTTTGKVIFFRLLAAVPPLVGAGIIRDLGEITNYTGIVAFIICFVFPALLQWRSKAAYRDFTGLPETKVSPCDCCHWAHLLLLAAFPPPPPPPTVA